MIITKEIIYKCKNTLLHFNIQIMKKTINITEELHQKIKIHCAKNKLKINEWIEKELNKIINDNNEGS